MADAEGIVRSFLGLLERGEAEAAVALLHDDIEWRNTGLPTVRGRRVAGMLRDMERRRVRFSAELHHVAVAGDVVLIDRTDVLRIGRWETTFWVRGTFEVVDGKIRLWDDAFSWGDFARGSLMGLVRAVRAR